MEEKEERVEFTEQTAITKGGERDSFELGTEGIKGEKEARLTYQRLTM